MYMYINVTLYHNYKSRELVPMYPYHAGTYHMYDKLENQLIKFNLIKSIQ